MSHALLGSHLRLSHALLTKLKKPIVQVYISEAINSCCILFIYQANRPAGHVQVVLAAMLAELPKLRVSHMARAWT